VNRTRRQILAFEQKWSVPTGAVTFVAVVLIIAAAIVISSVSGSGEAELLTAAHEHSSDVTLSSILEAVGYVLLAPALFLLFRAASSRSQKMKRQLIGLAIVAPLAFGAASILNAAATNEASDQFAAGEAKSTLTAKEAATECRVDEKEEGAKDFGKKWNEGSSPQKNCEETKVADDEAENALTDAGLRGVATVLGLIGRLGLAITLVYGCLYAMRVGLLTRFWGSLGMALGVAALLLLVQFTLIFFIYLALLLIGRLPGGKPPAWAAGEAIPWPSPGEKMAAEMEPKDADVIDVDAVEEEPPANGNGTPPDAGGNAPRKRKQRD
jgi:hypothetical protein